MASIKHSLVGVALSAILAVGFAASLKIEPLREASAASAPTAGTAAFAFGGTLANIGNPGAFSLVAGDQADAATLAGLPGVSLAYFAGVDVNTQWSTGVPYSQASAGGWLLKDASGNLLVNQGYTNNYVGDVGNAGYQQAWASNVLAFLAAHPGLKGVVIDDVLYDLTPLAGKESAKYPTQSQWASAMLSFIASVGPALRAKGYYVLVNASGYVPGDTNSDNGSNTANWWRQLGPYVDGFNCEYWLETADGTDTVRSTGPSWTQNWDGWQQLVTVAQSLGKDFVGAMHGPAGDVQRMTYGRASFLLDWAGHGGAFAYLPANNSDPTNTALTTDIGQPLAAKQQVGIGWMRSYSGGVAIVNPSPSTTQAFQLGGSYVTAAGATVTSITLGPTTGAILRATTAAPVPAPTTPATTTTAAPATTTAPVTTTTATPPPPAPSATTTAHSGTTTTSPAPTPTSVPTQTTTTPPPTTTTATTPTTTTAPRTTTTTQHTTTTTPKTPTPPRSRHPKLRFVYKSAIRTSAAVRASGHTVRSSKRVTRSAHPVQPKRAPLL
jgi:hypothetical protein